MLQDVENMKQQMSDISKVLEFYNSHTKDLSDFAFIQLIGDLTISGVVCCGMIKRYLVVWDLP